MLKDNEANEDDGLDSAQIHDIGGNINVRNSKNQESGGLKIRRVHDINRNLNNNSNHDIEINFPANTQKRKHSISDDNEELDETDEHRELNNSKKNKNNEEVDQEPADIFDDDTIEMEIENPSIDIVRIKTEPADHDEANEEPQPSTSTSGNSVTHNDVKDIKPAIKVEKVEANSTTRNSCKFGIKCYRRHNARHCEEEAHPGDSDYTRPTYPPPAVGSPACQYGHLCYRRNPDHFRRFSHPPNTNPQRNYENYRAHLRQRRQDQNPDSSHSDVDSTFDNYESAEEPFSGDEDPDYVPNSMDMNDEDDFDYDDCDKAEE